MGTQQQTSVLSTTQEEIMNCLLFITVVVSGIVVANASGPPPPPPYAPPPPHVPYRPAPYGYRPHYGPVKKAGGLESILPLLLLGGKSGSSGLDSSLLPLLLLGGKGGKKGGANALLPYLLLSGDKCTNAPNCVEPNTPGKLCGAGAGSSDGLCCVCPKKKGLFGSLGSLAPLLMGA